MKVMVMCHGRPEVGIATKVPFGNPNDNMYRWKVRREDGHAGDGDTLEEAADNAGK